MRLKLVRVKGGKKREDTGFIVLVVFGVCRKKRCLPLGVNAGFGEKLKKRLFFALWYMRLPKQPLCKYGNQKNLEDRGGRKINRTFEGEEEFGRDCERLSVLMSQR